MINDKTHYNMMIYKQREANSLYYAPYKGSIRPQIGHKLAKMGQN